MWNRSRNVATSPNVWTFGGFKFACRGEGKRTGARHTTPLAKGRGYCRKREVVTVVGAGLKRSQVVHYSAAPFGAFGQPTLLESTRTVLRLGR